MTPVEFYSGLAIAGIVALWLARCFVLMLRPRPFTDAALEVHRETMAEEARLRALRQPRPRALPHADRPLPPPFMTLGDAANDVLSGVAARRGGVWTDADAQAVHDECRRSEAAHLQLISKSDRQGARP